MDFTWKFTRKILWFFSIPWLFLFEEITKKTKMGALLRSVYLQGKIYQKIIIASLIFSQKLAISNIFLPKSHVYNFGNNDAWNFKRKPLYP